jgi:hypothetical protein
VAGALVAEIRQENRADGAEMRFFSRLADIAPRGTTPLRLDVKSVACELRHEIGDREPAEDQ